MSKKKDKKTVDENLNELFGIEEAQKLPAVKKETGKQVAELLENSEDEDKLDKDFELSRSAIHNLMTQGEGALAHYIEFVFESESPRAYEVLAKLLDTLSSLSKDNIELHNMKKSVQEKLVGKQNQGAGAMNINHANIMVGTTADLQKALKAPPEDSED